MTYQNTSVIIIGGNHINTLGLIRSAGEIGIYPDVILEPCNPKFCTLRFSKYISKLYPLESIDQLLPTLIGLSKNQQDKPIVICGSDHAMSIIDANMDIIAPLFHTFNIHNTQGLINRYLDKTQTFGVACKAGFDIIRTWNPSFQNFDISQVEYPCIVKGINSIECNKTVMAVCHNIDELQTALENRDRLIIQDYIEKDFELDIVGISIHNGKEVYIGGAVRKIRETIESQSQYDILEPLANYPQVDFDMVKRFVKNLGYEGIFSIEIMCCKDKVFFLEINLRNDGTSYMYTAAGINYVKAWIDYCKGKQTDYMAELISNLLNGSVSPSQWLKDFFYCDSYFVLSRHDLKPFIYQLYIPIRQLFKKTIKLFRKNA